MKRREAIRERSDARHWRRQARYRLDRGFAALPYGYRSSSHAYALHERFGTPGMHERFAMRGFAGHRGYPSGYSEDGYGADVSGGASSGRTYGYEDRHAEEAPAPEYGEEGPPPSYGEEGPDYGPEDDGYAAGYSSGGAMSINAPAALDSWHGYGVECPPY